MSFIKNHPALFIAIAESITIKKNEEREREKFQLNVSTHINGSTDNYYAATDTSYNFKKKPFSLEEETMSKKKDKRREEKKSESHPLALIGLCLIPPIFLVTAIWACIENQPFFADCKALQKELENEREEEYFLLKEHIKNIQYFNHYEKKQNSDENKKRINNYNKAYEALIYNKSLIEEKSEFIGNLFDEEVSMCEQPNPYQTTSYFQQPQNHFNE